MTNTSKLRWAFYEDVYQPALVFPAEELADTALPPGHTVVYLLGLDSNVMVADAAVSEYDPHDTAKMSNPAAALGVAMAQQILEGFQSSGSGGDDAGDAVGGAGDRPDLLNEEEDGGGDHDRARASDLRLLLEDDGDDDVDDDDARRRRHEEKKLRKEEKRREKEAKRAAKAAAKREREDITSAPTIRHGADVSANSEDDDNELLAAMAIEQRYNHNSKVKPEKVKAAADGDGEGTDERNGQSSNHKKAKKPHAGDSWAALEEDLFSTDDEDEVEEAEGNGEGGDADRLRRGHEPHRHPPRSLRSGNRMGQALAALNATSALHDVSGLFGSCPYAQPFLMEIHYEYEQLAQEASSEGLLLTLQKGEVVRAIDDELRQRAAQRAFLEAALTTRQHHASSAAGQSEEDALDEAIAKLEAPLSVAETVRRLVGKQMPSRAIAFDRMAAARARRAVQRRTRTFQDATVVTLVDHLRSVDAAPREDGAEVMRRYILQRRQHEELKSNFRGLSKTGFYAVPKPMEKWRRARDMMMLANVGAEAQKVLPTSYISQAHSTMVRRMKEHAEKRYDRMAVTARDGASFLDINSFSGNTASSSAQFGSPSPAMSHQQQQQLQQQRLAASSVMQRREAFFQFHALRCDAEAPVTVETVALNPDFAGAGLSQNVLASVGDLTASVAPVDDAGATGPHAEDALRTDDDASQVSYSAHSAAPSSYPYVFDSEPRLRRPHRRQQQRGGSMSGAYSSASDGASVVSSRATSVGSVFSERDGDDDGGVNGEKVNANGARRHRRGGSVSRKAMNGSASATAGGGGTADWRTRAKRSIMEQLTLYCRGRGGRPAILSSDQCREIGRTLLDRAMRAEAERQGVSLAVQSNNLAAPFTKTTEQRLKKSVDHYLERRMAQNTLPVLASGADGGRAVQNGVLGTGDRGEGVLPLSGEPEVRPYDAAAVARQRAVADTPVYEN
ncbi:hypothetical protein ABB37_09039 [Leptomonas pyrrhocoris]|uniref:Uncharacterized protein n=1 Tax=Leptomonas pyrrhocoris TaxID=157538 RepID=A0A0M9FS42_LEPPY|nr:hypothetical protein ABB37_09039 [Leptomonas pyrrhocoris]KPA74736.1 hypothetical protein ABB37_09039 [Leptomonas pyrrhocoris]|eukprot:XP_015653175.1 hypothetical protein ABB37_09039 [Leptomonas pyrrhocoris]